MADEILVRYKQDISQIEQSLDQAQKKYIQTEVVGNKAFATIGKSSETASKAIDRVSQTVANAGRQFNGLHNSVSQIGRELPNFAVNLNTGFLAISNNLPILFDELSRIKKVNAELLAQNQQAVPVWKQLGSAVFSWGTALSVGITLLTVFGGKIVEFISGSEGSAKAQEEEAKAIKAKNDELRKQQELVEKINVDINQALDTDMRARANRQGGLNDQKRELELLRSKGATEKEIFEQEQTIRRIELDDLQVRYNNLEVFGDDRLKLAMQIADKEKDIASAAARFKIEEDRREKEARERQNKEFQKQLDFEAHLHDLREKGLAQAVKEIADEARKKQIDDKRVFDARMLGLSEDFTQDEIDFVAASEKEKRDQLEKTAKAKMEVESILIKATLESAKKQTEIEDLRREALLSSLGQIATVFGSIAQLAGANTEAGKALAIAETTISTYVTAQQAYEGTVKAFKALGPIALALGAVAAGAAVVAGLARVQQITSVQVPKPEKQQAYQYFATGVVGLQGPGTETSDDIPAYLSRGESVITAKATSAKKDELRALNYSVLRYDQLIQDRYVRPALEAKQKEQAHFAEQIAYAVHVHASMGEKKIVKAIKDNRPATRADIKGLTQEVVRSTRESSFKDGHYV